MQILCGFERLDTCPQLSPVGVLQPIFPTKRVGLRLVAIVTLKVRFQIGGLNLKNRFKSANLSFKFKTHRSFWTCLDFRASKERRLIDDRRRDSYHTLITPCDSL